MNFSLGLDLFPMLAAVLAATTCGLLGNFLVLRRISLMGDAISHSVLPGLVAAFLLTGSRAPLVMFGGAALAGIATVVLVEAVKRLGRVEPGAAMGVVFSVLFALGVLLIREVESLGNIDLDADCVLHGQLEANFAWYTPPATLSEAMELRTWLGYTAPAVTDPATGAVISPAVIHEGIPGRLLTLAATAALAFAGVALFFKELRIASFDPALATTQGFHASWINLGLMLVVAAATVAAFEAVGSILVIAMLICPAATARLLTDRLATQLALSVAVAIASAVGGYVAATAVPAAFGREAVNAAGSMAVMSGVLLTIAALAAPRHGLIVRLVRRSRLAREVAIENLLLTVYRGIEAGADAVAAGAPGSRPARRALRRAERRGLINTGSSAGATLSEAGRRHAVDLLRRHRLWERYLVDEAGLAADHVHATAEQLEHVAPVPPAGSISTDPHGRPIPSGDQPRPLEP